MKSIIKTITIGVVLLGSISLIGCSSTNDFEDTKTSEVQEEQNDTPTIMENTEITSEDYNEGWNFMIDMYDGSNNALGIIDFADRVVSRVNDGSTVDAQEFIRGYVDCGYDGYGMTKFSNIPTSKEFIFNMYMKQYLINTESMYTEKEKVQAALELASMKASMISKSMVLSTIVGYNIDRTEYYIDCVNAETNEFIIKMVYRPGLGVVESLVNN